MFCTLTIHRIMIRVPVILVMAASFAFSSPATAINKCTDSSGNVVYSDQPCEYGSTTKNVETKTRIRKPTETASTARDAQCADMDRVRTPDEMIARAQAIQRGEIPEGKVCCKNGKVVQCE